MFVTSALLIKLGFAELPRGATWSSLYGVAILTGIGFTMSLFIGSLAFEHSTVDYDAPLRAAVLGGSVFSALVGYSLLRVTSEARADGCSRRIVRIYFRHDRPRISLSRSSKTRHDSRSRARRPLAHDADGRLADPHQSVSARRRRRLVRRRYRPRQSGNRSAVASTVHRRHGRQARQGRDLHAHAPRPHRSGRHDLRTLQVSAADDARGVLPGARVSLVRSRQQPLELAGSGVLRTRRHAARLSRAR